MHIMMGPMQGVYEGIPALPFGGLRGEVNALMLWAALEIPSDMLIVPEGVHQWDADI